MKLLDGEYIRTSHEMIGGKEGGILIITWRKVEQGGILKDIGIIYCDPDKGGEFMKLAGLPVTESEKAIESFILENVQ